MVTLEELNRRCHERLVEAWERRAVRSASARGMSRPELINMIPTYIDALAASSSTLGTNTGRAHEVIERHLSTRLRQGFDLAEVIEEITSLGSAIVEGWSSIGQPDPAELEKLFTELQLASASITDGFDAHMREEEQALKRLSLRLSELARNALSSSENPLREKLHEVLGLVMEAMGASTAALALFDAATHQLSTVASVGAASKEVEKRAMSLSPESFTGQIAMHDEAVSVNAATTDLEVDDALRESGIHSLLGLRLPPRQTCVGVMYIGIAESRPFSAREIARLEAFGAVLIGHLETAQLVADLRATVARLNEERELRETFVSVLAHDLRGPLSSAKAATQRLIRGLDEHEQRDLAVRTERNIDRADRMIRDLLDANRIHAGEPLSLRTELCDLREIAEDVVEELRAVHGDRFVIKGEKHVRGRWSADLLRRGLWNLAVNAVKYGAAGRPITIAVGTNGDATLSVHNEGAPIPEVDRDLLFTRFSRAPAAERGRVHGWGLGLTLVRGAAEAHGGTISVSSDETGTTFTIRLPLDPTL